MKWTYVCLFLPLSFASCMAPPPLVGPFQGVENEGEQEPSWTDSNERLSGSWSLAEASLRRASYQGNGPPNEDRADGPETVFDGSHENQSNRHATPLKRGRNEDQPLTRVALLLNRGELDDDSLEDDDRLSFGIEVNLRSPFKPLSFEIGFNILGVDGNSVDLPASGSLPAGNFFVDLDGTEVYAGVRAEYELPILRPYIGGGGTLIRVNGERYENFLYTDSDDDDDLVVGGYVHAGVECDLFGSFFIGVDFRQVLSSSAELFGRKFDMDYSGLACSIGLSR